MPVRKGVFGSLDAICGSIPVVSSSTLQRVSNLAASLWFLFKLVASEKVGKVAAFFSDLIVL